MVTVEAIQALLEGYGLILYPGTPDSPPNVIAEADIVQGSYRIFPTANEGAPVFHYAWDVSNDVWRFKKKHEATK